MTNESIREFFLRYEQFFMQSLDGDVDVDEISSLYAQEFIAASPMGTMSGKNDHQFQQALVQGYEQYRQIGTKKMTVRSVKTSPIDELHCVAHVAWTATYATAEKSNIAIDFEVHYLMQELGGKLQIFGWIAGDEQKLLKDYGVIKASD
ncbi:nuclear transport factor 2 family protein [Vagococcus elongatus]|uniref:DUF4440 domain-containing protein n=1 Tax=Vagococcus elongatus TaxID=180344 RepID=A0A430AZT7_9ENTE|nr:nuclear transport factor 2 family protein [Vagococcus elongatus]RSU13546.1 hypothetical protein CBF29_04650 [Vagococcus elongatus]